MKKIAKKFVVISMAASLSGLTIVGCTPGNNTTGSTVAGAAAGGLLGAALFHGQGSFAGVAAGALIGGIIGNQIGQKMDRQDRANMTDAIRHVPVNEEATWRNNRRDITYTVRPTREYSVKTGGYCREYQTTITVGGETKKAYGKACRQPDGQWKIVS